MIALDAIESLMIAHDLALAERRMQLWNWIDADRRDRVPWFASPAQQLRADLEHLAATDPASLQQYLINASKMTPARDVAAALKAWSTEVERQTIERPELHLADAIRAIESLAPDERARLTRLMLAHLGFVAVGDPSSEPFRARLGDEPEVWGFWLRPTPATARVARRVTRRLEITGGVVVIDWIGVVEVAANVLILGPDATCLGTHDLLAAAAHLSELDALKFDRDALRVAARARIDRFGDLLGQLDEAAPSARAYRRLVSGAAAQVDQALETLREYRGAQLTVPRRDFRQAVDRFLADEPYDDELPVMAVIGSQGVGKTSAAGRWLQGETSVPAVFLSARVVQRAIQDDDWRVAPPDDASRDLIAEARAIPKTDGPTLLLVLDGLNEASIGPLRAALTRPQVAHMMRDGIWFIVTCWPTHWRRVFRPVLHPSVEVRLTDFDDDELAAALMARGVDPASLPRHLLSLIRRPALMDHILKLRDRLETTSGVSRMDVFFADLQYKAVSRWIDAPGEGPELRAHFVRLVQNYQRVQRERGQAARAFAAEVARWPTGERWARTHEKLMTLAGYDFVHLDVEATVSIPDDRLAIAAMALLLCEEMRIVEPTLAAQVECARKVLDEIGDLNEPIEATVQALGFALALDDPQRALTLTALLCDNRNFSVIRLAEFGRRMIPLLISLTLEQGTAELFERPEGLATQAWSALQPLLDARDAPRIAALLKSPDEAACTLAQRAILSRPLPELIEPLLDAAVALMEADSEAKGLGYFGYCVSNGFGEAATAAIAKRLAARRPHPFEVSAALVLGAPSLAPMLIAHAARLRYPAGAVDYLPLAEDDETLAALRALIEHRPQAAVARALLGYWGRVLGHPFALDLLERFGPGVLRVLYDNHIWQFVIAIADRALLPRLATWALATPPIGGESGRCLAALCMCISMVTDDDEIAAQCMARGRGLPIDFDMSQSLLDIPAPPTGRHRWRHAAKRHGVHGPSGFEAEVWPEEHAAALRAAYTQVPVARRGRSPEAGYCIEQALDHLLPPALCVQLQPTEIALHDAEKSVFGAALRLHCWIDDAPQALALLKTPYDDESRLTTSLATLGTLSDERVARDFVDGMLRTGTARGLVLAAHAWGPLRRHRLALSDMPEIETTLTHLEDDALRLGVLAAGDLLGANGAPLLRSLIEGGYVPAHILWGVVDRMPAISPALIEALLERTTPEAMNQACYSLRKRPLEGADRWLRARTAEMEEIGPDAFEREDLWTEGLLGAAGRQQVPISLAFLEALWTPRRWDDYSACENVLSVVATQHPAELGAFLRVFMGDQAGMLMHAIGPLIDIDAFDVRVDLLAALCADRDPDEFSPRPDFIDLDDPFVRLARRPMTTREFAALDARVKGPARANLAWLAVHSEAPQEHLAHLRRCGASQLQIETTIRAGWHLRQRDVLREGLARLAADPAGFIERRDVVLLIERLDGTFLPELERLERHPEFAVARMAWWLRYAATHRPKVDDRPRP